MKKERLNELNRLMEEQINCGSIRGASVCVIHNNEVQFRNQMGHANFEKGIPMKEDTIFRLYSMTKPVTSVAVMILYERGLLDLMSPVENYLEGFKNQKVLRESGYEELQSPVTIQHLLDMTAGVVYPDSSFAAGNEMQKLFSQVEEGLRNGTSIPTVEFMNEVGRRPLEFQPGESWRYGACADVLGAVVEVVSGMKYGEFLKKEIFEPLGMVDTDFYVPVEKQHRFAEFYEYKEDKKALEPCSWRHLALTDCLTPPAFESGGAGLVSTIDDYAKFARMLCNGGSLDGVTILGRKTVEAMAQNHLTDEQLKTYNWDQLVGYGYGNLVRVMIDPSACSSNGTVGEYGWDGWTGTYFFNDPKENLIMLYMIQKCGGGDPQLMRKMRNVIYGALD